MSHARLRVGMSLGFEKITISIFLIKRIASPSDPASTTTRTILIVKLSKFPHLFLGPIDDGVGPAGPVGGADPDGRGIGDAGFADGHDAVGPFHHFTGPYGNYFLGKLLA